MGTIALEIAKSIAPLLIKVLKEWAKTSPTEVDDIAIDTIEFLLRRIKILV